MKKLEAVGMDRKQAEAQAECLLIILEIFEDQLNGKQDVDKFASNFFQREAEAGFSHMARSMEARLTQIINELIFIKNEIKILNKAIQAITDNINEKAKTLDTLGTIIAILVGMHSFFPNVHV